MRLRYYFILFIFLIPFFSSAQIFITEVMYNPKGNDANREWIEAINFGEDIEVKTGKKGWRLFDGKNNRILKDNDFIWKKNEVLVFVKDKNAFLSEYKNLPNVKLVESAFSLNNKGATIRIIDENKKPLAEFVYSSSIGANGNDYSLINENGIIKEGKIIKGTPGIYPEPFYTNEPKENKILKEENGENLNNRLATNTLSKEAKEEQNSNFSFSNNTTTEEKENETVEEKATYLIITEFLPNPEGKDINEFIEIYNPEDYIQKLDEVILVVGAKKIKLVGEIKPKEYKAFYKNDLNFNIRNKGEEISLINKDGKEIFYIKYKGNAPKGLSFSRDDKGKWHWAIPTPNKPNIFEENLKRNSNTNNSQEVYLNKSFTITTSNNALLANQLNSDLRSNSFYNLEIIFLGVLISVIFSILILLFIK